MGAMREFARESDSFAVKRIVAVSLLQSRSGLPLDDRLSRLAGLGPEADWKDLRNHALGPATPAEKPFLALLAREAGAKDDAIKIVESAKRSGIDADQQIDVLKDLLEIAPAPESVEDWVRMRYDTGQSELPEWIWLVERDGAKETEEWIRERGADSVRRARIATAGAAVVVIVSAGALLYFLFRRSRFVLRERSRPLFRGWSLRRLWFEFLLAQLVLVPVSFVVGFTGGLVQALTGSGDLTLFGTWIVSQGVVPIWLFYRLMPGFGAGLRVFGMSWLPWPWSKLVAFGLGGTALLAVAGSSTIWLDPIGMLRDGVNAEWLDRRVAIGMMFFLAAVVAPFCEEIVYRGFLFGGMREKIGPVWSAIVTSVVFAAAHFYVVAGLIAVVGYGLVFCWLYHRSGSLWPGIVAHAVFNFTATWLTVANYSLH